MSAVLVVNSGSSSVKYQLVDPVSGASLASGVVEKIGETSEPGGVITHREGAEKFEWTGPIPDHSAGLRLAFEMFARAGAPLGERGVAAVGHRVVHGGTVFSAPTIVTDEVLAVVDGLSALAPLHNPANVLGIAVARELFPDVPHVAVFDTAFFRTLPEAAATYAIDHDLALKHGVRRYGFHGTSHSYVSGKVAEFLGRPAEDVNQIVLHLGNGASASAVRGGVAVDTSMGLTPLEGLVMGTRSGDIDPGVLMHLRRVAGLDVDALDTLLNRNSGIKGISGVNDFRELRTLIDAGDERAVLAYGVYIHRLRKYVGAYLVGLGRLDAIAFTAGVGENDAHVRADALAGLSDLGIEVDEALNTSPERGARVISTTGSKVTVLVMPTNEELAIAQAAWKLV